MQRISDVVWEIPTSYKQGMRVPARIYATEKLLREMDQGVFNQATNVACLPGILKHAYCMPDGHWGYGFPIGGVAAFDPDTGVISPGGIGFDINCGMRLIRTDLTIKDVKPKLRELVDLLFQTVPAGVGARGFVKPSLSDFNDVLVRGVDWCIEKGYAWGEDRERIEEHGCLKDADPSTVSHRAIERGLAQLGTLGSGNHYLEIQIAGAAQMFDAATAEAFGIFGGDQIVAMVHCGSRGFGHQIGTDYLRIFLNVMNKYGIRVLDRELACAPFKSPEGQDYYKAMCCSANMAFANRQVITHRVREAFQKTFNRDAESLGLHIVYDVAHNIAKVESHVVDGKKRPVVVHRKGATRCFGPGREELAPVFRKTGQPVILGGSMETGSYLLVGTEKAELETFGSTAHGSGRTMSRAAAKKKVFGSELQRDMEKQGIYVKAVSMAGLAEEAGVAYKNISDVVETMERAGISRKVVAFKPIGNIKG
ncbi:MAG: RtcB family protein [Candidatus Bathyarchaeia archaeon]